MIDDVIKFYERKEDLEQFSEHWEAASYEQRSKEIVATIVQQKGFPPSPNMKYIREGVFSIKRETTMKDLISLGEQIKEKCVIDCFQISIDRDRNECHMLFDWYDRKDEKSFHLYGAYQLKLSVLILRVIDFPAEFSSDDWIQHYLRQEYADNPDIIEQAIDFLNHASNRKRLYLFVLMCIRHAEKVCQGQVK